MSAMSPGLTAEDFMALPRYQVYTSFMVGGVNAGWISGKTYPAPPAHRDPVDLRALSQTSYGKALNEVEDEFFARLNMNNEPIAAPPFKTAQPHLTNRYQTTKRV